MSDEDVAEAAKGQMAPQGLWRVWDKAAALGEKFILQLKCPDGTGQGWYELRSGRETASSSGNRGSGDLLMWSSQKNSIMDAGSILWQGEEKAGAILRVYCKMHCFI